MEFIYCSDPLHSFQPDEMYQTEANTARSLGSSFDLIDFEALVNENNPLKAVRRISQKSIEQIGIYRGWMK
jgi:hypothetical protein